MMQFIQPSNHYCEEAEAERATWDDFLRTLIDYRVLFPAQRRGQSYFNVLSVMRPEMAEQIRGGCLDPFYVDGNIGAFMEFVSEHWEVRDA